ncbi:hypothetical protein Dimus_026423 [Dionaea muscipula]
MYAFGRLGSYITRGVYTVSSPFHPFGGAVDVIVVEQQDGSFKSSPWYVRFGKFQGVLKAKEKVVSINVNGVDAGFHMYLDHKGEAYFLREVDGEEGVAETYPLSSGDEAEGQLGRRLHEKSKSYNFDSNRTDLVYPIEASNGKMVTRTASDRSNIFGLVFGRRSIKRNSIVDEGSAVDVGRVTSLERAEIAADLLEVKWSTNLAPNRRRKGDASNISDPNLLVHEPNDASHGSSKESQSQALDRMIGETVAQIPCSASSLNYMESFTLEETYLEVNFVPERFHSFKKEDNIDPDSNENADVDKSETSNPVSTISCTVELNGNPERPFDADERPDKTGFSHDRSLSKVGSRFDRVESFMYYETVESIMEGPDVSTEPTNEGIAFMDSETGKLHVLPLDVFESIQRKSDAASEQVSCIPVIDAVEDLGNGDCSESLDGSNSFVDEKTPVPSVGYCTLSEAVEAEVSAKLGSHRHDIVDGGPVKAVNPVEEVKEVYFDEVVYLNKPSVFLKGELATELGGSGHNIVGEGPLKANHPVEELDDASLDKGSNLNESSATAESDTVTVLSIKKIKPDYSCTTSNSLILLHQVSGKNIADDLPGGSSTSNLEVCDGDLQEKGTSEVASTSSEEELFHFSDLNDPYSEEIEKGKLGISGPSGRKCHARDFPESNGEEVNESGSTDSVSHFVEDQHSSHLNSVEMIESGSSPINIPEVHIESDKESLNPLVESLPSMQSLVYDMKSHFVHPALSHSLDSKLENLMLIKKDVPLPSESDDEEAQPSTPGYTTVEDSEIPEELKKIVSDPAVELSLCRHLLYEGMGYEAASRAFDGEKLDADKFASFGPCVIKNDKLVVRIGGLYLPWEAALPIASAMGSSGSEQILEPKGIIAVEKAEEGHTQKSDDSKNPAWRLWPFTFQKSKSIKSMRFNQESPSENTSGLVRDRDSPRKTVKTIRATTPTSEQLASLNLKAGQNVVTFTFSTAMLGEQQVDARIYLWKWNTKIVISDVDGTITKSDVLGQFMPLMGMDWSQTGVAHLFSAIKENGYQLLFLSARAISQAYHTRQFLFNLKQDGKALPEGPVVISPDGLFPSLYREVIRRAPHEFKIACLEDIKALFPPYSSPFYAGFGNRDTDEMSYLKVGIPKGKIFIINPKGEIAINRRVDTKSYMSLHALVHDMFPPVSSDEQEDFNSWNYWKLPPPGFDV